jgi:hypothetical protein
MIQREGEIPRRKWRMGDMFNADPLDPHETVSEASQISGCLSLRSPQWSALGRLLLFVLSVLSVTQFMKTKLSGGGGLAELAPSHPPLDGPLPEPANQDHQLEDARRHVRMLLATDPDLARHAANAVYSDRKAVCVRRKIDKRSGAKLVFEEHYGAEFARSVESQLGG